MTGARSALTGRRAFQSYSSLAKRAGSCFIYLFTKKSIHYTRTITKAIATIREVLCNFVDRAFALLCRKW
jgi:hypothetical protein